MAARPPRRTVLFWGEKHPQWKALSTFVGGPLVLPRRTTGSIRTAPTPKEAQKRRGRMVQLGVLLMQVRDELD